MFPQYVNVALGRSGTKSLYWFFSQLGINSHHQNLSLYSREGDIIPYDMKNIPKKIIAHVDLFSQRIPDPNAKNYFNSDWAASPIMLPLHQLKPNIKFLITVRDPISAANSLRRIRMKDDHPAYHIDYFVDAWLRLYTLILNQSELITPKPTLLKFGDLISGKYDNFLLKLFNLKTTGPNKLIADVHWAKKVNSLGKYKTDKPSPSLLRKCSTLIKKLEAVCTTP